MTDRYTRKRREECVLFLDDAFDAKDSPRKLLEAGYCRVESFVDHFKREDGSKEESVKDPRVIRLCEQHGWLMVTTDSDIRYTHTEEIKKCKNIAILAAAHNSVCDIDEWVEALILAKAKWKENSGNDRLPGMPNSTGRGISRRSIQSPMNTNRLETESAKTSN